jgi:hypothetical protein
MNGAFCRHALRRPKGNGVRFGGMHSGVQRQKGSGDGPSPEPAPLARRRPGYSSSGCTPAEPDSASPGACSLGQLDSLSKGGPGRHRGALLGMVANNAGSNGGPA